MVSGLAMWRLTLINWRTSAALLAISTSLVACMNLPGSDAPASKRYLLKAAMTQCETGDTKLSMSVAGMNAGLDSNRIALHNAASDELSYLRGARWAAQADVLLEQRMADDLECAGYSVQTGHHQSLGQRRLVCEVRAFSLVRSIEGDRAEVALSCVDSEGRNNRSSVARSSVALDSWSSDAAVAALGQAYAVVLSRVLEALEDE